MIGLVHGILILLFLSLFLIAVFYYLVHLNLVSNASWALRNMVWVTSLALVDVVFASSRTGVGVDASNSLVGKWTACHGFALLLLLRLCDIVIVFLNIIQCFLLAADGIYR